jgi:hypothetical protein
MSIELSLVARENKIFTHSPFFSENLWELALGVTVQPKEEMS